MLPVMTTPLRSILMNFSLHPPPRSRPSSSRCTIMCHRHESYGNGNIGRHRWESVTVSLASGNSCNKGGKISEQSRRHRIQRSPGPSVILPRHSKPKMAIKRAIFAGRRGEAISYKPSPWIINQRQLMNIEPGKPNVGPVPLLPDRVKR